VRDLAFIALGSNVGDRETLLANARDALQKLPGSRIVAQSSIEETEPVGPVEQSRFLNQMIAVETTLAPRDLLSRLLDIETAAGRIRGVRWGPRTLDLDIVRFARQTVNDTDLHVPHPELNNRPFWLRELAELESQLDSQPDGAE
jgi:2-amino-4-hydroxy-6-hydroxymethyldihydropteridine diphosphokinase